MTIQYSKKACLLITVACAILPMTSFGKANPVTTTDLLQSLKKGEPWDKGVLTATKTVMFEQTASGGTDASSISKITLAYFTSADCTGSKAGSGFYTTPNGTSYTITAPFGMVAASAWNVGSTQLSIADMTTIQSIAVTFKSTNNNTPQANFSGLSYACIPVTCTAGPSGECTSASGTQTFTLKTSATVGDPADGGVIGCQNTGISFNLFNIVVTTTDQSTSQGWGPTGPVTGATTTSGETNTADIVDCQTNLTGCVSGTPGAPVPESTYAAGNCNTYSADGGFTSGWFLPSGGSTNTELNCLYNNRAAIATGSVAAGGSGFASTAYWSSNENNFASAFRLDFSSGGNLVSIKTTNYRVRCVRAF